LHTVFELPCGGGLGATYTVRLRLTEKLVVDFLFVLIELFLLGATAEALRANTDWKSALTKGWSVLAKFLRSRGHPPRTTFARIDRPVNALQLWRW